MPQELIICQHMPKRAGTSLRKAMLASYAPHESVLLHRGNERTSGPPPRRPEEYKASPAATR
jgi:hypothetical protein